MADRYWQTGLMHPPNEMQPSEMLDQVYQLSATSQQSAPVPGTPLAAALAALADAEAAARRDHEGIWVYGDPGGDDDDDDGGMSLRVGGGGRGRR